MSTLYYETSTHNNTLSHHGVLGQKWGKRNGPPYPLNASDHSSSENKTGWRKSLKSASSSVPKDKDGNPDYSKMREDLKNKNTESEYRKKVLGEKNPQEQINQAKNSANSVIESSKRINNAIAKNKKAPQQDLSKMTDKELRDAVNRLNLERQYRQMTEPEISVGYQKVNDILDVGGSIVAGAAGIATLALTLKKLCEH